MHHLRPVRPGSPTGGKGYKFTAENVAPLLKAAMKRQGLYTLIKEVDDKRRKADRIIQTVGDAATAGELYIRENHFEMLELFKEWSPGYKGHEDLLDALAIAIMASHGLTLGTEEDKAPPLPRGETGHQQLSLYRAP
jgi:hypothetical protein